MDTSETYIKMRLAAILDLGIGKQPYELCLTPPDAWVDAKGDFYTHTYKEPYYCQLERQDQLQEMVKDTFPLSNALIHWFEQWFVCTVCGKRWVDCAVKEYAGGYLLKQRHATRENISKYDNQIELKGA
ncbi:hypothetical protein LCGC14_2114590 [marine sediment metagenome]|uniref:Uncharacterized protein n=1 Tax=marine sediment metagenome TaxID=412755 RepID=A0A0F9H2D7_9ZZZZ